MATEQVIATALATPINESISPEMVEAILSSSPFISVPGTFNSRDLSDGSIAGMKPGYAFRSGTLERVSGPGVNALQALSITTVFDLRSLNETHNSPLPKMEAIDIVWVPSTVDNETAIPKQVQDYPSIHNMFASILESHRQGLGILLRHVLEHPDIPFLFHCTAGKDRTGVAAFLLHSLAGSPTMVKQRDYALTRVGIEPVREFLLQKLVADGRALDLEDESVKAATSLPEDLMENLDALVEERYGGVRKYVVSELQFTQDEVEQISKNLQRN